MLYALTFRTSEEGYLRMASLPITEQAKGDPVVAMTGGDCGGSGALLHTGVVKQFVFNCREKTLPTFQRKA
jgi:hypothetical protein